jgi:hypothetical protein
MKKRAINMKFHAIWGGEFDLRWFFEVILLFFTRTLVGGDRAYCVDMVTIKHNSFSAEVDIDPDTTLLRGRIVETGAVFYARYNHQLEARFRAIVDNLWFDTPSRAVH